MVSRNIHTYITSMEGYWKFRWRGTKAKLFKGKYGDKEWNF